LAAVLTPQRAHLEKILLYFPYSLIHFVVTKKQKNKDKNKNKTKQRKSTLTINIKEKRVYLFQLTDPTVPH